MKQVLPLKLSPWDFPLGLSLGTFPWDFPLGTFPWDCAYLMWPVLVRGVSSLDVLYKPKKGKKYV